MKKELCLRSFVLMLGFFVTALGSSLFLGSNLGTEGFSLTCQGVSFLSGLSVGTVTTILSFSMMGIMYLIDKSYVKIGAFLSLVVLGPSIDFWSWVFGSVYLYIGDKFPLRLVCLACAIVILCLGISLVMSAKLGTHINDAFPVLLSKTVFSRWGFRVSKMSWDTSLIILGTLLGGVFGIGTIASACGLGPILQVFIPKVDALVSSTILAPYTKQQSSQP